MYTGKSDRLRSIADRRVLRRVNTYHTQRMPRAQRKMQDKIFITKHTKHPARASPATQEFEQKETKVTKEIKTMLVQEQPSCRCACNRSIFRIPFVSFVPFCSKLLSSTGKSSRGAKSFVGREFKTRKQVNFNEEVEREILLPRISWMSTDMSNDF